jgi:hypothetical protein
MSLPTYHTTQCCNPESHNPVKIQTLFWIFRKYRSVMQDLAWKFDVHSLVKQTLDFMKTESSSQCSQRPAIRPYSEFNSANTFTSFFPWINFNIIMPHTPPYGKLKLEQEGPLCPKIWVMTCLHLPNGFFPWGIHTKFWNEFLMFPCMLHALPSHPIYTWLIPCSRVILQNLMITQLLKKCLVLYGIRSLLPIYKNLKMVSILARWLKYTFLPF